MKRLLVLTCFLLPVFAFSQTWTKAQLDAANTAKDIDYLEAEEKAAIQYINLARLYPAEFADYVLAGYHSPVSGDDKSSSKYRNSLKKELKSRKPVPALQFDEQLFDLADCFADESGKSGVVTHKRKSCSYGYAGECCSYGMETGKDIAMQWLIDAGIKNLAHRVNCLNKDFTRIGLSVQPHKVYDVCAVADFK